MDPRPVEEWAKILGGLPAPEGANSEQLMADRILGDLVGYLHPNGNENTRRRRLRDKEHDRRELANAMVAYGRMMFDAGVRP